MPTGPAASSRAGIPTTSPGVRKWSAIRQPGLTPCPPNLIGKEVQIRMYADWAKCTTRATWSRVRGEGEANVNYRHHRLPGAQTGAFDADRLQLFPTLHFRRLRHAPEWRAERADVEYVRILHLAATTMEATVDSARSLLLEAGDSLRLRGGTGPGRAQGARGSGAHTVWDSRT